MTQATIQYPTVASEYAVVTAVNHPLVRAKGFQTLLPNEVVIFANGVLGQVLSFDEHGIDIMIFSETSVAVGTKISRTGTELSFPVSKLKMGTIFSPLGESIFGTANAQKNETFRTIFRTPPAISTRTRITEQLETGYSLTDILLPIGCGQRELLVGDRKAGKSDFARGVALTQARLGTTVVYGMIGKKVSDIKRTYDFFKKNKILDTIVMIASTTQDPVSTISVTPMAAMSVAEHLVGQGNNVLLILDDLTTHAEFYRELSLLAKRFPVRDSYPGDIFYLHAQLLERAGVFLQDDKKDAKGIALTCLPVVRTVNSDLTDFITSNLISITDGHLLFDTKLYAQGLRPAIDTKLSVTRVGKQTQTQLQRDLNQKLTSFIAEYNKTKNLTHLGSEISRRSQDILQKGDLFTRFMSDSTQEAHSQTVRLLIVGMIWAGWFTNTHENVLLSSMHQLNKMYQTKDVAAQLNKMVLAESFDAFLKDISQNETMLRDICQI